MKHLLFFCLVLAAPASSLCQLMDPETVLSGVVTRIASPADFDVNGVHIVLSPATQYELLKTGGHGSVIVAGDAGRLHLHLGQTVEVTGRGSHNPFLLSASSVSTPRRKLGTLTGAAIVEAVLPSQPGAPASTRVLRADGYTILLTPKTAITYDDPLSPSADISVNTWITYTCMQQPDGAVVATKARFSPNHPTQAFLDLRTFWDYDPASVPGDAHQGLGSRLLRGIDPSDFPLHHDTALQSRLDAVAGKLIPAWHTALPASDPSRINFRFFVIDSPNRHDAAALPSGIILVPFQIMTRLSEDGQLAAVIADKIAGLLEQQPQALPLTNTQLASTAFLAGAEGFPIAGVGLAAASYTLGSGVLGIRDLHRYAEQRERVSLTLLHNAGYDIAEAPIAWWRLAVKPPQDTRDTHPPQHAVDLFRIIGQSDSATPLPQGSGYAGQQ